jgi:hypothetical protein
VADVLGIPVVSERWEVIPSGGGEKKNQSVLQEAGTLITGDRQAQYGPPTQDFERTAAMWTALFKHKLREGEVIRPQDVAWSMICVKLSRLQHKGKRDSIVDIAGYAECGWKCVENEGGKPDGSR